MLPLLLFLFHAVTAKQVVLLDTRTSTSELRWKTYSVARTSEEGWLEETVSDIHSGRNSRAYVVCEVDRTHVDNWLLTPYVQVTFTMRDCTHFPRQALTCGETFTLLYHESARELDADKGDVLPPWKETPLATQGFKKIDRITGDTGRFSGGGGEETQVENVETKSIAVSKGGLYFAFRDEGACISILRVRIYYDVCETVEERLVRLPETTVGAHNSDVVDAHGTCVENAVSRGSVKGMCLGNGVWRSWDDNFGCKCRAGFVPSFDGAKCQECVPGKYALSGDAECRDCPLNSASLSSGNGVCPCQAGYYRDRSDPPTMGCTKSPGRPLDARIQYQDESSVTIVWNEPVDKGGRSELWYTVECRNCPPGAQFSPGTKRLNTTRLTVRGLLPGNNVAIVIKSENDVTDQLPSPAMYAIVEVNMGPSGPGWGESVKIEAVTAEEVTLVWRPPPAGPVRQYQVEYAPAQSPQSRPDRVDLEEPRVTLRNLKPGTDYRLRVRALTESRDWSEWSHYVYATTATGAATAEQGGTGAESTGTIVLIIVGCVIVLCLVVIGAVYASRHQSGARNAVRKPPSDLDRLDYRAVTAPLMPGTIRPSAYKPYIDPFDYEDPNVALREFTHELDPQYLYIEEVILGGEFGEVHQGKLRLPGRPDEKVAIKSLLPNASQKARDDFLQEAAVMGQFDHPNVVRLKGVVSRSDPVMIITEFMANKSLDHFLRQNDGVLSLAQMLAMLRGIAAGMKYLSDKGYVHRDLAARNVLVNECLECKISDFGLSRGMSSLSSSSEQVYHTKGGKIPVRWTAPEAITHRKYTSSSDVWSMGIVCWEVASYGERPYWDWSNQEVIKSVEQGYRLPPPLNCPAGLHSLMLDCWKKERSERPSFATILRRLDEFVRFPELAYAASSTTNSTLSSDLYDHTMPPSLYHQTTTTTLPNGSSPSPHQPPPPPAPLGPPPLPSLQELLDTFGLGHFARLMAVNGVDSVPALARLGIVDLMTYGLGQADCQRLMDAVRRLTATPATAGTLSRRHPPLPTAYPSIATLSRPGPDQGYFI